MIAHLNKQQKIMLATAMASGAILGGLTGYALYWPSTLDKAEAKAGQSVGELINITTEITPLGSDLSRIETDKGIFYVKDSISALKGQEVSVKESASGDKYLCFEHRDTCRGLVSY